MAQNVEPDMVDRYGPSLSLRECNPSPCGGGGIPPTFVGVGVPMWWAKRPMQKNGLMGLTLAVEKSDGPNLPPTPKEKNGFQKGKFDPRTIGPENGSQVQIGNFLTRFWSAR